MRLKFLNRVETGRDARRARSRPVVHVCGGGRELAACEETHASRHLLGGG